MYIYHTISLQVATLLGLLFPEYAVITNCRNVGTYLPVDTASKPTLLFSSVPQKTSLWLLCLILHGSVCTTICTTIFTTMYNYVQLYVPPASTQNVFYLTQYIYVFGIMLTINRHDTPIEHWYIYLCNEDGVFSVRQDLYSPITTHAQSAVCCTVPVLTRTVRRHWCTANKQNLPNLHCVVSAWLSAKVFVFEFQPRSSW